MVGPCPWFLHPDWVDAAVCILVSCALVAQVNMREAECARSNLAEDLTRLRMELEKVRSWKLLHMRLSHQQQKLSAGLFGSAVHTCTAGWTCSTQH